MRKEKTDLTKLPSAPPGWHHHKNGGGLVEDTATVDDTAFVGPDAQVSGGGRGASPREGVRNI